MKIRSLKIKNFRGIREVNVTDAALHMMVIGYNGSGKTSILDAIRAVLVGRVQDRNGNLQIAQWIGPHAKSASVDIEFVEKGERFTAKMRVQKTVALEIERDGLPPISGTPKEARAALWDILGVNQKHRECGLTPTAFLIGDEIGQMISDLGGASVDQAKLDGILGENSEWFRRYAASIKQPCDSVDGLLAIGANMFTCRTGKKALRDEKQRQFDAAADLQNPVNRQGKVVTTEQRPQVMEAIAKMKRDRDAFIEARGAIKNDSAAEQIERAKNELNAIDLEPLRAAESSAITEYQNLVNRVNSSQAAIRIREQAIADRTSQKTAATAELKAIESAKPPLSGKCPTCGADVPKSVTDAAMTERDEKISAIQERIADHEAFLTEASEELKTMKHNFEALSTKAESARKASLEASTAVSNAQRRIHDLNETISAASADEDEEPQLTEEEINSSIATLDASIEAATTALNTLNSIASRDAIEAEIAALSQEIDRLSWAIPLFHNDKKSNHASALNGLSGNEQQDFIDRVNARLEPFNKRIGLLKGEKTLIVTFGGTDSDTMIPIAQASGAEILLAEWAVAAAFVGDDGLILLDEFNRLDGLNRPLLTYAMQECESGIWAAAAYSIPSEPDLEAIRSALDPIGVVWVG